MPYPGCEFFRDFKGHNYTAESLKFDWDQSYVDAEMCVKAGNIAAQLKIKWDEYKVNLINISSLSMCC